MKLPVILLVASLIANVAFIVREVRRPSADASASTQTTVSSAGGKSESTTAAGKTGEAAKGAAESARLAGVWEKLQGGDIHTLPERLRAAGFPSSLIKAIVSATIYEQFADRRRALLAKNEETPYWLSQQRSPIDPKSMAEIRQIGREQLALMKELLGPDGYLGSEETAAFQKRQFGDLSRDKLDSMQNIVQDYNELRQQIYQNANGVLLPEDREKLALLEKEQRNDMTKLLSPEELENYDLRSSNTANTLRNQLGTFKPSEEEFKAIFRATRDAEEKYGSLQMIVGNDQMMQIRAAVLDGVKNQLSPERIADLKQGTDPQYQQINRLVARLELPASASNEVVAVQQDIQKRAGAVRGDRSLSNEQRVEQLTTLQQEASSRISTALGGARGLEAYKGYGGQWIQTMVPRPPPNPMNVIPSATK